MWAAVAAAVVLFGALLAFGWSRGDALSAASGALLLACIGICVWAWVSTERDWRRVPPYGRPPGAADARGHRLGRARKGAGG